VGSHAGEDAGNGVPHLRVPGARSPEDGREPLLAPIAAQRIVDLVAFRFGPAVTGGLLAYQHVGEPGSATLLGGAILFVAYLTGRIRYPLHLMPATQFTLAITVPVLGALLALGIGALAGDGLTLGTLVVPVIGASLIMLVGAWVSARLKRDRPVRIAVVGTAGVARILSAEVEVGQIRGFEVVGWVGLNEPDAARSGGLEWLGSLDELRWAVVWYGIDLLVYVPGPFQADDGAKLSQNALLDEIARGCIDLPVRMLDANQLYEDLLGHVPLGTIDAAWFRYIMHPNYRPGSPLSKRLLDVVFASVAALMALPLVAIAAVAIKLDSSGPVLFRQRRVGEHGREFEILKLRTMRVDSELGGDSRWTSVGDQRLTRVGRILRRTHVDELPQLWNVLRGELSLVGPRPERPDLVTELERQINNYERRHLVKPGITGWAQIRCGYAGSEMGSAWKLCHDLYYLKHRSLLADVLLMVETVAILPLDPDRDVKTPSQRFLVREASRA
jgi:exopolysaccharide biosynthesis polyprenyl glycosylphosphotransferase